MRFIIAKGARKREILTPFGICADRADFESLRDQINTWLEDEPTYGWLFVQARAAEMGPPNSHPEMWDA